jgi:hypothetical protein
MSLIDVSLPFQFGVKELIAYPAFGDSFGHVSFMVNGMIIKNWFAI